MNSHTHTCMHTYRRIRMYCYCCYAEACRKIFRFNEHEHISVWIKKKEKWNKITQYKEDRGEVHRQLWIICLQHYLLLCEYVYIYPLSKTNKQRIKQNISISSAWIPFWDLLSCLKCPNWCYQNFHFLAITLYNRFRSIYNCLTDFRCKYTYAEVSYKNDYL